MGVSLIEAAKLSGAKVDGSRPLKIEDMPFAPLPGFGCQLSSLTFSNEKQKEEYMKQVKKQVVKAIRSYIKNGKLCVYTD